MLGEPVRVEIPGQVSNARARALRRFDRLTERWSHRSRAVLRLVTPQGRLTAELRAGEAESEPSLRLLSLNVAHGRRLATHQVLLPRTTVERNLFAIASVLRREAPDVVALQEADGPSAWSGNFDHVSMLARLGGLGRHFRGDHNPLGRGRVPLASGTALLARHPLRSAESHSFETSWRDTKGFVLATVDGPRIGEVDVVSVHLDFLAPRLRCRQLEQMIDVLRRRARPLIVLGDLNADPVLDRRTLHRLQEELHLQPFAPHGWAPTFPSPRPRLRLDWILISPELEFSGYRHLQHPLSDHLGVLAEVRVR